MLALTNVSIKYLANLVLDPSKVLNKAHQMALFKLFFFNLQLLKVSFNSLVHSVNTSEFQKDISATKAFS